MLAYTLIILSTILLTSCAIRCPSVCTCLIGDSADHIFVNCTNRGLITTNSVWPMERNLSGPPISARYDPPQPIILSSVTLHASWNEYAGNKIIADFLMHVPAPLHEVIMCCSEIAIVELDAFKYSGKISKLDMSQNNLKNISFIRILTSLTELNLDFNHLRYISTEDVKQLENLKKLSLKGNQLLTSTFLEMTLNSLTWLDLSRNELRSVAVKSFYFKPNITYVNISSNLIKVINFCLMSPFLSNTSHLEIFDFTSNPLLCGCHMSWMLEVNIDFEHGVCAAPSTWNSTAEIMHKCKSPSVPICSSGEQIDNIAWDPYVTLPEGPDTGEDKVTYPLVKDDSHDTVAYVQIFVLLGVGFAAIAVIIVAVIKHRRLENGALITNSKRPSASKTKMDGFGLPAGLDEYELKPATDPRLQASNSLNGIKYESWDQRLQELLVVSSKNSGTQQSTMQQLSKHEKYSSI